MNMRALLIAILVLIGGPVSAASTVRAVASPKVHPVPKATLKAAPTPPMVFYVVKGAPDACGRGCDSWIAAEGQIDSGAALRFRKFWAKVRDGKLPIYFSSPGGSLDQALAMGAMLRERPVVARVARTVVRECGFEAQDCDVCVKLKQSGANCTAISGPAMRCAIPHVRTSSWARPPARSRPMRCWRCTRRRWWAP